MSSGLQSVEPRSADIVVARGVDFDQDDEDYQFEEEDKPHQKVRVHQAFSPIILTVSSATE